MTGQVLWRRLDTPGHDAARLETAGDGYRLSGAAVFLAPAGPARLAYVLRLARDWSTQEGQVSGFIGERQVERHIRRDGGGWFLDDAPVSGLDHCLDLDIGFTPATNAPQLRRIAVPIGGRAAFDVAWLDDDVTGLTALPQIYERRSERLYAYESPDSGYSATLEIGPDGFARDYPGLWRIEEA